MDKIVGHEKERLFLDRFQSVGRTLHFTGPARLGKKWIALQYAMKWRSEGQRELDLVLRGEHPDVTLFSPEGKTALHSVDTIRDLIDKCRQPPYQGRFRILIIDGADRMQGVSSNTLLKSLEEPLPSTFIFLISERKERMLPTILSRAIEISFSPIPKEILLKEVSNPLAVSLAKGSYSRAKEYATNGLPAWREGLVSLFAQTGLTYFMLREGIKQLVEPITALKEETPMKYFETVHELFEAVLSWYRDLHLLREGAPHQLLAFPDQVSLLEKRQEQGNLPSIETFLSKVEEAHLAIDRSGSLATTLESLLF